ncbi:MAG: hypothetical protein CFH06_01333 [Alphaproteobacteria bacterium MarineAlpha3_Bin5]|nr:MAG: hypothetical protein CFH06_01333 [Alphaproteobacteria bacterium MarineAlpha3_Bin5]
MKWQCRIRQISFRQADGRPSKGMMPILQKSTDHQSSYRIITVLNKLPEFSKLPELQHIALKTNDPEERQASAVKFFSEVYFQHPAQFSGVLTATFPQNSLGVEKLANLDYCILRYEEFGQRYNIKCCPFIISTSHQLYRATYWHNFLFNSSLPAEPVVLGFQPNWESSAYVPVSEQDQSGK